MEDFSIENSARSEAEQKILAAASILILAAKKLEKKADKQESIDSLNQEAMTLLNFIEPKIVKVFLDENGRLDYFTETDIDEIKVSIEQDIAREKWQEQDWASEWYDESLDQGQGMYLSDGMYLKSDGTLVDTKIGK